MTPEMREYRFRRLQDGREKAQGATVHATSLEEARFKAKMLFWDAEEPDWPEYVFEVIEVSE